MPHRQSSAHALSRAPQTPRLSEAFAPAPPHTDPRGAEAFELHPVPAHDDDDARGRDDGRGVPALQSHALYTPREDRAVRRKLDTRLVGFMALLYCLSFLDRSSAFVRGGCASVGASR